MFVARIALSHAFKKVNKNVTEQLTSNSVSAQIFLSLLDFEPWCWEYMQSVCVFENITFCSLFIIIEKIVQPQTIEW